MFGARILPVLAAAACPAGAPAPAPPPAVDAGPAAATAAPEPAPPALEVARGSPRIVADDWIGGRLATAGLFTELLAAPEAHRLQIVVGEIATSPPGPRLVAHGYRVDAEYFFAASAIKTLASVAALRRLAALGVGLDTPLRLCRREEERCRIARDASNRRGGTITIGHEIRKMHLVSDNRAFNRLYDFVGARELNEEAGRLGFSSARIRHRMGETWQLGAVTPRIEIARPGGSVWIERRESELSSSPTDLLGTRVGAAHLDASRRRVDEPRDFSRKNYVSLRDLFFLQVALVRPELAPTIDLGLSPAHREFLLAAMTEDPSTSDNPRYTAARFVGQPQKPMFEGVARVVPADAIRCVNKAGKAYGFHLENAYIEDTRSGRAFFVVAGLYADRDGVVGDDRYAYDELSRPFFAALGELLARELLVVRGH